MNLIPRFPFMWAQYMYIYIYIYISFIYLFNVYKHTINSHFTVSSMTIIR